jgi:hypothetical protein
VLEIDILALNVTGNGVGRGVLGTGNLEGDIGRGQGLDFERGALDGIVLQEEVRGGLAEVLFVSDVEAGRTFQEGGTGWDISARQLRYVLYILFVIIITVAM